MDRPRPEDPKSAWRAWARQARAEALTPTANLLVLAALRDWPPFQAARNVLTYLPFGTEVDPSALHALPGKRFFITRTPAGGFDLSLHPLDPDSLERHRFGFEQPRAGAPAADPAAIDLALVPGLAFDRRGARLGYGRGYYDRLLRTLPPSSPLVGVTLDALIVPCLPASGHDVPVTHLASEAGVRGPLPADRTEGR